MHPTEQLEAFYRGRGEVFLGEVTFEHISRVINQLAEYKLQGKPLILAISSPGGDTNAGFDLAQFIEQELNSDVTARVWGRCHSASTYALLCCKKRLAHPESTFVIHRQTTAIEFQYTDAFEERIAEWSRDNALIHNRQVQFYSRKLALKSKKVIGLLDKGMGVDSALSAKQALNLGLITKITSFK